MLDKSKVQDFGLQVVGVSKIEIIKYAHESCGIQT
jgi:hypothetical protein